MPRQLKSTTRPSLRRAGSGGGRPSAVGRRRSAVVLIAGLAVIASVAVVAWLVLSREAKPAFSGERAMRDLSAQVAFGPRVPGSEGHRLARAFLVDTLSRYADRVGVQEFVYTDPRDSSKRYPGANITASFNLDARRRVMLAAHWDTRPVSDQDPDSSRHHLPVPGANDGASGTAVLLEMARLLDAQPPGVGVDFAFFDLEDMGEETPEDTPDGKPFAIGSEYFAANSGAYRPAYGILLDMVCDRNLRLPKEGNSVTAARAVVDKVWSAADRVGADAFQDETGRAVYDDHIPFLRRGIPFIDIIHTPFPSYWHTTEDTPDKCSAASLQQVGDVLVEVIYEE